MQPWRQEAQQRQEHPQTWQHSGQPEKRSTERDPPNTILMVVVIVTAVIATAVIVISFELFNTIN